MATQLNLTDNMSTLRTNFNGLVVEFNDVASISSVTTDAGIISVGSGQTNRNININGGSNIQTNVNGASIEVNIVTNPVFAGLSATGTVSFTGTFSASNATIGTLTVGTSAPTQYTFPTAVGTEGQALVVNASGDLEFGLGGIGVTNFKGLTDTPSDYSTLGARVLLLDGSPGGIANNVVTDSEFTFDSTNNTIFVRNIDIGNSHSSGETPLYVSTAYASEPANTRDVVFQNTLSGGNSNNFTSIFAIMAVSGSTSYQNIIERQSVMSIASTCVDVKAEDISMTLSSAAARTIDKAYIRDASVTISDSMRVDDVFTGDNIEMIHSTTTQVGADKIGNRVYMSGQMSSALNQYGYLYQADNNALHPRHVAYFAEFNNAGTGFKVMSVNAEGGANFGFSATIDNDGTSPSRGLFLDVSSGNDANRSILVTDNSAPSYFGSSLILDDKSVNPVVGNDGVWFYAKDTKLVFAYDEGSSVIRYTVIDLSDGTISNSTTAP